MKAIKSNMRAQILTEDRKILYCTICGDESSGNAGDYWNLPDDFVFQCPDCKIDLTLVNKLVTVQYT